jgi:hypothetical protein
MRAIRLVAVAGALVTAACGGGVGHRPDLQRVVGGVTPEARAQLAAAAQKTAAAPSARIAVAFGVKAKGLPDEPPMDFRVTGEGAITLSGDTGELRFDMTGIPKDTDPDANPAPAHLHVVIVGGVGYLEIPAEYAARAPSGARWARLSASDSSALLGLGGSTAMPGLPDLSDPAKALEALRALGDTKEVGRETLRGVDTVHYGTQASLADAFRGAPATPGATTTTAPEDASVGSADHDAFQAVFAKVTVPVDAWVGDGLVRRVRTTVDLGRVLGPLLNAATADAATADAATADAAAEATQPSVPPVEFAITTEVELFDYGTPVVVAAPPAGQVVDASAVAGLAG